MTTEIKSGDAPEAIATVALPLWNCGDIAWLPLESLCVQENCDFPWELIVLEDGDDEFRFGVESLRQFADRLAGVGCVRIVHEQIPGHPALSDKWKRAAELASPQSVAYFLQGGDDWTHPHRVANATKLLRDQPDINWVQNARGFFYDACTTQVTGFDYDLMPAYSTPIEGHEKNPIALEKATRTAYIRQITRPPARRSVDGWTFFGVQEVLGHVPRVHWDEDPACDHSLYTTGFNSISHSRIQLNREISAPFHSVDHDLKSLPLPAECKDRLFAQRTTSLEKRCERLLEQYGKLREDHLRKIKERETRIERLCEEVDRKRERISRLKAEVHRLKDQPPARVENTPSITRLWRHPKKFFRGK